jgi:CheY-like chemotaxis protein
MMSVWEFDPETSGKRLVFEGVKALVVDDEEMNLIVAKGILSGYGMNVTLVRSGREAIKECEQNRYDVIFMDHMMPEMDGVEAMKTIKINSGSDDHTAMIAFSANAVSGVRDMFMKEGFDEFIAKPIDTAELERVLKKLLPSTMWQYKQIEDDSENIEEEYDESYSNVDKFSVLNAIEGIRHCRGSEALYEEVLKEFASESDELISDLQYIFESKDWENYGIKLNAIKLSARLIGAEDLAKEAQAIEKAAAQSWEAYIAANHDSVIHRIQAVTEDITRVYGGDMS